MKNNTSSKVKNFISLNSLQKTQSLRFGSTLSLDEKSLLLPRELRELGASPSQIKVALVVLTSNICNTFDNNCVLKIHKAILTKAHFESFSKLLISQKLLIPENADPKYKKALKEALNVKGYHLEIPTNLKSIYAANFLTKDLFELSQNRANLYKTFIDRGLQIDGTINPQFAIPEMATVFEKLEKQFLLLRRAVNMNPVGVKDFF